jgi:alanine transaminase
MLSQPLLFLVSLSLLLSSGHSLSLPSLPRSLDLEKAIEAARAAGQAPDTFYCLRLVEEAGICIVPGSGFGQKDGTYHFRITILPPEDQIEEAVTLLRAFHENFLTKYS